MSSRRVAARLHPERRAREPRRSWHTAAGERGAWQWLIADRCLPPQGFDGAGSSSTGRDEGGHVSRRHRAQEVQDETTPTETPTCFPHAYAPLATNNAFAVSSLQKWR